MDPISIAVALAQFAPQILRWLSGSDKAAEVAEKIVAVAKQVTGREDAAAMVDAIRADPAVMIQFRQAIASIEAELDKAYLADRQDARRRDVMLSQAGVHNTRANAMVAMDAIGLAMGIVSLVVVGYFQARYPDALSETAFTAILLQLSTITGYFGLCLRDAHQFEFGSSRSSANKTELLSMQAEKR